MKNILIPISVWLFLGILLLFANTSYGQKEFLKLVNSTDTSYGYIAQNALRLKKGNQGKSIAYSYNFLSGLKTQDNQTLTLLFRATVDDPNYKKPSIKINNKFTGMPISGKLDLLDKYVFLTSNTKDTIRIFIDVYNTGTLMLPQGLKYEDRKK